MSRGANTPCQPSPGLARPRNNAAIPTQRIDLSPALTGYWLNGHEYGLPVWSDGAGSGLTLTEVGSPVEAAAGSGKFGGGASPLGLDGASFLYRVNEEALRVTGDVTFCAWVYPTVSSPYMPVFEKGTDGGTTLDYSLSVNRGRPIFYFISPAGGYWALEASTVIPLNAWSLLICGYDSVRDQCFISVNGGAAKWASRTSTTTYNPVGDFVIGAADRGSFFYFTGRLNQVARWDRLLNLAERTALMADTLLNMTGVVITAASSAPTYPVWNTYDAPAAPTNLSLDIDASNQVDLAWLCEAVNAIAIEIWRGVDGAALALYGSVTGWTDTYTDTDSDTTAHSYAYKLRAVNYAGASAFTSEVNSEGSGLLTEAGDNLTTEDGLNIILESE